MDIGSGSPLGNDISLAIGYTSDQTNSESANDEIYVGIFLGQLIQWIWHKFSYLILLNLWGLNFTITKNVYKNNVL